MDGFGRAKAKRRRSFPGGHAERWRFYDGELNCAAMNKALQDCLDYCNNRRPHRSLGMRMPAQQAILLDMAA